MNYELVYFLKVNVAIAIFYIFYRFFFYRDTFFMWRRISLMGFLIVSILYPLLTIQDLIVEQNPLTAIADLYAAFIPEVSVGGAAPQTQTAWGSILSGSLMFIYIGGVVLLLTHFLIQLISIIKLGVGTRTATINGVNVHILTKAQGPFSFFKWIFIYPSAHTQHETDEILTHELTHVRQWHSLDVICSELMCVCFWFNPFVWLIRKEIRNNLEYLADHKVIANGYDHKTYQYHLLGLAHQKTASSLSNNFNILPLKNRIKMMNKKRTRQIARTKYLMFSPVIVFLLIASNMEIVARTTGKVMNEPLSNREEAIPVTENAGEVISITLTPAPVPDEMTEADNTIFEVVEQMPEYPGGQRALMEFLARNIRYPRSEMLNGVQGRVIIQFIVDKDGTVTEPTVVRKVSPEIDKEAMRVITSMPKWTPGKQRGKPVRVKYTVPVRFRLQE